jgi:TolB-like protein
MNATAPGIFISYSREDAETAKRFAEGFTREGFNVWWDASLRSGEIYDEVTENALRRAKAVVVLWSKRSVASRWVRAEATIALRNGTLVPAMIEACDRPVMFELTQTADLTGWRGNYSHPAWQALVADVRRFVENGACAPATEAASGAAHFPPPAAATGTRLPAATKSPRRIAIVAGAAGVVAAIAIGALSWPSRDGGMSPSSATAPARTAPAGDSHRTAVAVLPFANLTGDPDQEHLADGIATQLISTLGRIPSLTVPSRTSSFSYRGQQVDAKRIARELGVGTILEGSLLSAGEVLQLTVSLVDARTDRQFWSESFQRPLNDLLELHDELARAIVAALTGGNAPLTAGIADTPTNNPVALKLYLDALGRVASPPDAIELLDEVIKLDSGFAAAYGVRAGMRAALLMQGHASPATLPLIESDARRALELSDRATGHPSLAVVQAFRGQWLEADRNFRAAMVLAANEPLISLGYISILLDSAGYLDRALALSQTVAKLAPSDFGARVSIAKQLSLMGREAELKSAMDGAIEVARLAGLPETVAPLPQIRASSHMRTGNFEAAAQVLKEGLLPAMRQAGAEALIDEVAAALADPAKRPAALASIDTFVRRVGMASIDTVFGNDLLNMQVMLGSVDQAYQFANRLIDVFARDGLVGFSWGGLWVPEMAPFRRDPHFHDFASRLNLPELWRVHGPPDGCRFVAERIQCP